MANYALSLPNVTRSTHPLVSYAAVGKMKDEICRLSCTNNYGARSPLAQMVKYDAKNLFVGVSPENSINLTHYIEQAYGVPYIYNKLLKYKPINNGVKIDKNYIGIVRYIEYNVNNNPKPFCDRLRDLGLITNIALGDGIRITSYNVCYTKLLRGCLDRASWVFFSETAKSRNNFV